MDNLKIDQEDRFSVYEHVLGTVVSMHKRCANFERGSDEIIKLTAKLGVAGGGSVVRIDAELIEDRAVGKWLTNSGR